jgi:hypothetical protein
MRSLPVEFLDFVEGDLRYASKFYDSWQFEGAKKFREKFRETIFWIGWNPEMFPGVTNIFDEPLSAGVTLQSSMLLSRTS